VLAVAIGLATLLFVRLRAGIGVWVRLHTWLHELGMPDGVRHLDSPLLLLGAALLGSRLAAGRGRTLAALGLRGPVLRGLIFAAIAGAPMWLMAPRIGHGFEVSLATARSVLLMPFVEEVFFRGLLVVIPVALGGVRFWPAAIAAGLLFGSVHLPWDSSLGWGHAPVFAVTAAGGIWYAWLCRCFSWNLWATIALHAVMNGTWAVFLVADDAAGGLWANVARAATIAVGTVLALRARRAVPSAA
jgi:membrane protease YdiL (CAAX protease family)